MRRLEKNHAFSSKINIILSSYNHCEWLGQAVESIASQTFENFQCFVVDDNSTDGSIDLLDDIEDERFFLCSTTRNPSWAEYWNELIFRMPSESYFAMAHSDDVWRKNKLKVQYNFMEKNDFFAGIFSNVFLIDQFGEKFEDENDTRTTIFNQPNFTRHELLRRFFQYGNCLCHPTALIRVSELKAAGGYRTNFTQLTDFDLWIKLAKQGTLYISSEKLIYNRIHSRNESSPRAQTKKRSLFENFEILTNFGENLTTSDLMLIFPEFVQLFAAPKEVADFALGLVALKIGRTNAHRFFGLVSMHKAFSIPGNADLIWENYKFSKTDLSKLTEKISPF